VVCELMYDYLYLGTRSPAQNLRLILAPGFLILYLRYKGDARGNKVGTNRPDVQYDKYNETTGKFEHHVVEYDNRQSASTSHGKTIKANDPKAVVELNVLK
jgi:hypothetical protein